MRWRSIRFLGVCVCLAAAVAVRARPQSSATADSNVVVCRAMESHSSEQPPVAAVVFHQRNRQDGPRLGELLLKNSGANVEIQIGQDGSRQTARVFRLKSCFGRGLLVLPTSATAPKDGETFTIKFPTGAKPSAPR